MKKIILLATILLVAKSVSAQTYFGSRSDYIPDYESNFGLIAGANISNISSATNAANFNTRNLTGFSIGFDVDLSVSYPFSIMPGLLFAQKGFTANTPSGEYTQHLQAVELPVLAKLRAGKLLSFFAGPQVSYIMSASNKYSSDFPDAIRERYEYGGAYLRYQGVLGLGIGVTRSISIQSRYSIDLTGTSANGNPYVPTYRGHVLQLGFEVKI